MTITSEAHSRRAVLAGGVAIVGAALLPMRARAQIAAVATAVQVAQFALGTAKLFQGSSIGGATAVELRILINLNKQIEVVQDGITFILANLAEIQDILNGIPSAVVNELTTRDLRAKLGTYNELLRNLDTYGNDIKRFRREKGAETAQLISEVRNSRQILFGFDSYVSIPVLSAALHVEYECRRLLGQPDEDVVPMTEAYAQYLQRVMYGSADNLKKRLETLRAERVAIMGAVGQARTAEGRIFNGFGGCWWYIRMGYVQFLVKSETTEEDVEQLIRFGLVLPDERPVTVTGVTGSRVPGNHMCNTLEDFASGSGAKNPIPTGNIPTWGELQTSAQNDAHDFQTRINLNATRIYAAASCLHAGSRSLNFCQQFRT